MKQCKYCGDSWMPRGSDTCYTCTRLKKLMAQNIARARNVFERRLLTEAVRANRERYAAILQELEKQDE